jgi:hypothetical protein
MSRYDLTRYRTTHNSYSGGRRGTLPKQLDSRIRCVELDFHDNGYVDVGDYRVGHLKPGMEVALGGGNPTTLLLKDWLTTIATWSATHAGHAPITIVMDLKDDLTDNEDGGDLGDLNGTLEQCFGPRLFTRDDFDRVGQWPDLGLIRDRVLCVLSGDGGTRASYRWAVGTTPALAINASGAVVLAYRSPAGELNCWSGQADALAGSIAWSRKTTYATSNLRLFDPAVAINDDGWVVAVHSFGPPVNFLSPVLESKVGRLQDDGRIRWLSSGVFAQGIGASLEIDGDDVREIHTLSDGRRRQQVRGTLNRQARKIEWKQPRPTQALPFARDVVNWQTRRVRCAIDAAGWIGSAFDLTPLQPARFRQLAFVELQSSDDPAILRDALFFGADAKNKPALAQARNQGLVARAWGFASGDQTSPPTPPQENMPATDGPDEIFYQTYMTGPDVAD